MGGGGGGWRSADRNYHRIPIVTQVPKYRMDVTTAVEKAARHLSLTFIPVNVSPKISWVGIMWCNIYEQNTIYL